MVRLSRFGVVVLALALTLTLVGPAVAQGDESDAVGQALAYLESVQNEDGGFPTGFAPESDVSTTADVIVAFAAAGEDPAALMTPEMFNPYYFLGQQVEAGEVMAVGTLAKIVNAVAAGGKDVTAFGGRDLVEDLLAAQSDDGLFGMGAFDHCLALIALQNAGAPVAEDAVEAAAAAQNEDGGWGFAAGEASDTNTTGLCLQALAAAGEDDAVAAGLNYLAAIQNEDGGWPYQSPSDFGTDSDANSTALVTQALLAAGEDLADWNNPDEWLRSLQVEGGAFAYQAAMPEANLLATVGVVPALAGVPLNAWMPEPAE